MEKINIVLTVDQVNALLNILGEQPHNKVHELMFTIYSQGHAQATRPHRPEEHVQWMAPNVNDVEYQEEMMGLS
jgi:hypothetical protein